MDCSRLAFLPYLTAISIAGYILYSLTTTYLRNRSFQAFAKQHGCQPPVDLTGPWWERFSRLRRILNLKKSGEDVMDDIFGEDFARGDTFVRTVHEGSEIITTCEPANIQAMLATQFDDFGIGQLRINQMGVVLGKSIFTSDGPFWAHSRALFRPHFSRDNINDLDSTEKSSQDFIAALGRTDGRGWTNAVDVLPLLYNFTLDTATAFLFGESVQSQSIMMGHEDGSAEKRLMQSQASSKQFSSDFELATKMMINRTRLQTLYWLADGSDFRKAVNRIRTFVEYYANKGIEVARAGEVKGKGDSLLARLATQTQDKVELRDQTMAVLVAGRDTTSALLAWAILRLALHPGILAKLRQAILTDFPPNQPMTFSRIKGCRYLQHFLNEVLRLHPLVPINGRTCVKDTTLPTGGGPDRTSPIAIREGQMVGFAVYFMHRRKDLWGEDALEFRPERWEQRIPAWQFLPFNGGPRICIGQQFALTEASFLLVRLLQQFDAFEPVDAGEMRRMKKGLGLTMWPADGVKVRFHSVAA